MATARLHALQASGKSGTAIYCMNGQREAVGAHHVIRKCWKPIDALHVIGKSTKPIGANCASIATAPWRCVESKESKQFSLGRRQQEARVFVLVIAAVDCRAI